MPGYELKSTIHSNQFMILAVNTDGGEFSAKSKVYSKYSDALHDAQKFAGTFKYVKYVVVAVAAVCEYVPVETPVTTTYKL